MASLEKLKNYKKMLYIFCYSYSSEAGFILDFSPLRYTDPKANLTVPDFFCVQQFMQFSLFVFSSSCNSLFLVLFSLLFFRCLFFGFPFCFWNAYKGKKKGKQ